MDLVAGRAWVDERRPIRHLDPVLLLTTGALTLVGLLLVYSATKGSLLQFHEDPGYYLKKQIAFFLLGTILLLLVASADYRFYKVYAGFAYAAVILALALVRTPLGSSTAGAQRWFEFAGFQVTPSEFTKIALVLMLANVLSELRTPQPALSDVIRVTGLAALPMLLVFLQPDIGTSIVLVAILAGVLVVAGTRARHLLALSIVGVVLILGAFQLHVIKDYQVARVTAFFDRQSTPADARYNLDQSLIAIGSGGITGQGYLHGRLTNLNFVPEQHTDFIFTAAGEEFGFVGSAAILLLFAILLWRAIRIAYLSKDAFGTFTAAGVASMFAIQMFVNVGMTIGIMPITGIPLPFVSYGGSAMLANYVGVGLLLNVHMRRFK
ncbi:MAG: rod shape-determining protein RodA [Actinobacteria bacterium]|nr:rod shape-determining protein RodA [Actinomycetota bacterium]